MSTESTVSAVQIKRFICRHIFTDGHRCGSPSLRNENFCYFHHATRRASGARQRPAAEPLRIAIPEDRAALLLTLGEVLQGIATRTIDRKDAGLLLYGLQIANSALPRESTPRVSRDQSEESDVETLAPVEETVDDTDFGLIAPTAEFLEPEAKEERKSMARQMLDVVEEYEERQRELELQQRHREEMEAAANEARSEGYERGCADAYANVQELADTVRAQAIAETEARLRDEFTHPASQPQVQPETRHAPDSQSASTFRSEPEPEVQFENTLVPTIQATSFTQLPQEKSWRRGRLSISAKQLPIAFRHSRRESALAHSLAFVGRCAPSSRLNRSPLVGHSAKNKQSRNSRRLTQGGGACIRY